jgi:precorrin-6A/cobalt-precorrin-6A reductase
MILVLGGTAEARELAASLQAGATAVTTSLAGRVARPRLPPGEIRIGGFGGAEGLARWLTEQRVAAVVDATHPFAQRISDSAVRACAAAGVPLLRLERPGWRQRPGDRWTWAQDLSQAAELVGSLGSRALLTTGRQGLEVFASVGGAWFLIRCVDPPAPPLPPRHRLIIDRGPYALAGERDLIERHRIDLVITKDSGGVHTVAKLDAARELGLPVIVVRRPRRPAGGAVTVAAEVAGALAWARAHAG